MKEEEHDWPCPLFYTSGKLHLPPEACICKTEVVESLAVSYERMFGPRKGASRLSREDLRSMIGMGFHTAFRKAVDNKQAHSIWKLIQEMPDKDWVAVCSYVAEPIADHLEMGGEFE